MATLASHIEVVQILLKQGASPSICRDNGWAPIHVASTKDTADFLNLLLDAGADCNSPDDKGLTPLHVAVINGCYELALILLDRGAGYDTYDSGLWSPLSYAVHRDGADIAALLLERRADLLFVTDERLSLVHLAAQYGSVTVLDVLLRHSHSCKKVDINLQDPRGATALIIAVKEDQDAMFSWRLSHGAKPDIADQNGVSALPAAAHRGKLDTVRKLLEYGANIEEKDRWRMTALHLAVFGGHLTTVEHLLKAGADPQAVTHRYLTPLHLAAGKGFVEIDLLIESGANIETGSGENGSTALDHAVMNNCVDSVRCLLRHGAQGSGTLHRDNITLHLAAYHSDNLELFRILAEASPNANIPGKSLGDTPLHIVVSKASIPRAIILLDKGADPSKPDNHGDTPLHLAVEAGEFQIGASDQTRIVS